MPHTVRSCQINHAYPPSITPLSGLKPITISELRLETHHIGRVLIVRTFTDPVRIQSVQSAVEDKNSEVDQLAVYNCDSKAPPDYMLPKDTVFAIKGPFYKNANNGGYIIRVDHLSDLVQLQPTHAMVPMELLPRLLELDKDALRSKTTGNAAFKKEYLKALDAYTEGLMCCSNDEDSLKRDLYRNRSIVNIYLHRYEAAFADATAAVIPNASDNETATRNNVRALFRAGRASYVLGNYSEAKMQFEQLLSISRTTGVVYSIWRRRMLGYKRARKACMTLRLWASPLVLVKSVSIMRASSRMSQFAQLVRREEDCSRPRALKPVRSFSSRKLFLWPMDRNAETRSTSS